MDMSYCWTSSLTNCPKRNAICLRSSRVVLPSFVVKSGAAKVEVVLRVVATLKRGLWRGNEII